MDVIELDEYVPLTTDNMFKERLTRGPRPIRIEFYVYEEEVGPPPNAEH